SFHTRAHAERHHGDLVGEDERRWWLIWPWLWARRSERTSRSWSSSAVRHWPPGASASSAAERRGPVRLPLVLAGLGAGGCCLGASCRRSCPGAAVDCARHALGWVGLLAVLAERYSVSTRTPAMGRR